ncbi:MAG: AMP-binding protein, partial [bacterium]|nr:AMP-binding protein [bacterium]
QQRLWFLDRFEPGSALYNIPMLLRLHGALDPGAVGRALDEIVRRHEVLRTRFDEVDGVGVQVIDPAAELPLPTIDLTPLAEPERRLVADRMAREEGRRPFDLARGPVLRVALQRLDREQHALLVTVHHIAYDGWSIGVVLSELAALYQGGHPPELEVQYADFALWQRQWLRDEVLEAQLAYWRDQLAGLPALELPSDRPRPAVQTFRGAVEAFAFPADLAERTHELGRQQGSTPFMTLLAVFQALMGRYAGQTDLATGSPIANRNRAETEALVGFFVNTLVLRADLGRDPRFRDLVTRLRDVALGAYAHQDLPFELLVEELEPDRSLSRNPLFQVVFMLQNMPSAPAELAPGLRAELEDVLIGEAKFDLTMAVVESEEGFHGGVQYNRDLFDAVTLRRWLGHFRNLLTAAVTEPERRLSELALLSPAEEQQALREWTDTGVDYPAEASVHELFEARVAVAPDAVAVVFEHQQVSYRELNRRANRLAHALRAHGVGGPASRSEVCVGLCLERSVGMVVATLGILKAGGAYLPLDPSYPDERLAFMLEDAGTAVMVIHQQLAERFAAFPELRLICLDRDRPALERCSPENPSRETTAENLAYIMYTSGSTGRPKGVAVLHRGVVRLVRGVSYAELS